MFGAAIGVVFGGAGYILLRSFCRAVSQKARVSPLLALANPAVLLLGAGLSAWLCPKELLWTGICMAAVLIAGAAIEAVYSLFSARKKPGSARGFGIWRWASGPKGGKSLRWRTEIKDV